MVRETNLQSQNRMTNMTISDNLDKSQIVRKAYSQLQMLFVPDQRSKGTFKITHESSDKDSHCRGKFLNFEILLN